MIKFVGILLSFILISNRNFIKSERVQPKYTRNIQETSKHKKKKDQEYTGSIHAYYYVDTCPL